ncbi:GINS complex subunit 1 [Trypanosoma conorhini]|uniref:GINS complex subunit 1 n=1 Tax=Trypanosoma conorhini TaxID=83891 RepID=A0A422P7Y5_9TRYP|nr:GINS complex subunit 1 [Trypanosoma conorhini]RNF13828.1 GINS complex subunit 1 [Trypanosoma conorhini]
MEDAVDPSAELINELRALVVSGGTMVPFDERKVRAVVDGISDSFRHLESISRNPYADPSQPFYASSMKYYRAKYLRDKRCLLAYLMWRQSQMTRAWWEARDNALSDVLAPCESSFLQEYNEVMVEYMTSFAVPLDLRAFTWRPPSTQQLEVRGLVNHVFVSPISGAVINLYKGKQILLGFEEAESLIQQGVVDLVE